MRKPELSIAKIDGRISNAIAGTVAGTYQTDTTKGMFSIGTLAALRMEAVQSPALRRVKESQRRRKYMGEFMNKNESSYSAAKTRAELFKHLKAAQSELMAAHRRERESTSPVSFNAAGVARRAIGRIIFQSCLAKS